MGWTSIHKRSGVSVKEVLEKEFNYDHPAEGRSGKVIACSANWTTAYLAYEIKSPEKGREVIAIVCHIHHTPRALDGYNFTYKDVSESMGPYQTRCPKTILNLLTPTTEKYALDWRKACWDRIEKKANAPKVKEGDWVKFKESLSFRSGVVTDTLQWVKGNTFKREYEYFCLPRWKEQDYVNLGQVLS